MAFILQTRTISQYRLWEKIAAITCITINYLTETEKLNNDVFACSLLSLTISFGSISEAGIAQLAVTFARPDNRERFLFVCYKLPKCACLSVCLWVYIYILKDISYLSFCLNYTTVELVLFILWLDYISLFMFSFKPTKFSLYILFNEAKRYILV